MSQNKPTVSQKKNTTNQKKSAPKASKAPKTQAFNAVKSKKTSHKSPRARKRIVIAIFVVIILILAAFATLIIGNILNKYKDIQNEPAQNPNVTHIEKNANDIKIGNLLLINSELPIPSPLI